MQDWNYSNLSRLAKSYGGPEKMLDTIKGKAELNGALKGGAITLGAVGIGYGAYRFGKWAKVKLEKMFGYDMALEQELIDSINEYDQNIESENTPKISDL